MDNVGCRVTSDKVLRRAAPFEIPTILFEEAFDCAAPEGPSVQAIVKTVKLPEEEGIRFAHIDVGTIR